MLVKPVSRGWRSDWRLAIVTLRSLSPLDTEVSEITIKSVLAGFSSNSVFPVIAPSNTVSTPPAVSDASPPLMALLSHEFVPS